MGRKPKEEMIEKSLYLSRIEDHIAISEGLNNMISKLKEELSYLKYQVNATDREEYRKELRLDQVNKTNEGLVIALSLVE